MNTRNSRYLVYGTLGVAVVVVALGVANRLRSAASGEVEPPVDSSISESISPGVPVAESGVRPDRNLGDEKPDHLSPLVALVMDKEAEMQQRLAAMRGMKKDELAMTSADVEVIYGLLLERDRMDDTQHGQFLKNELMDVLCEISPPPEQLGQVLVEISRSPGQHEVVRDYALQHMEPLYRQLAEDSSHDAATRDAQLKPVRQALMHALGETDSSLGGTALLVLAKLAANYDEFDRGTLAVSAERIAKDQGAGELARITAIQVSAQMGITNTLPIVWEMAQGGGTIPMQISAIGSLGTLAGSEAKPLLQAILDGSTEYLKPAARQALKQIETQERAYAARR